MIKKILFLIHDLGQGGAEKVLVNLVNNMDATKFDISVTVLFGGGVNEQFLKPHIHFRAVFPRDFRGNSHVMKLFTPRQLYRFCIKEHYDVVISYLEGPSARIVSGCPDADTKLVSWIHCTMHSVKELTRSFRSSKEAENCYARFHKHVFVAKTVEQAFLNVCPVKNSTVLYNTNESDHILALSQEPLDTIPFSRSSFRLVAMGKLVEVKGFDRLIRIHKRLLQSGYDVQTYVLGEGSQRPQLEESIRSAHISDSFFLLGYQTNPYKYISRSDLFICSSHSEGFSTAATEALIVGTPVCTVEVSGMKEMLGENNEWGIVTENSEQALYQGIKRLLDDPALLARYKEKAAQRGKTFSTENTVKAVEEMLMKL